MRVVLGVLLIIGLFSAMPLAGEVKIEGPFPAKDGERCVVCNSKLTKKDAAYLVDGRRFAVDRAMEAEFLQNPLLYVTKFRPERAALADTQPEHAFAGGYLWAGVFLVIGLMFGGACAQIAIAKGLSKWAWFVLGFFFSLPAVLALAAKRPQSDK
jgi:hypothetical protein